MGGDRGGRGSGPPNENYKLPFVLVRTSLEKQFDSPPPPPPPAGILFFYFLHVAGLAIILSRDNW